jgi:hypothetical protein
MVPSGRIFVDTPNAGALGLERFGKYWRGLETPRHLMLFTWGSLTRCLREAGFSNITRHPQPQVCHDIWLKSARIEAGFDPYDEQAVIPADYARGLPAQEEIDPMRTEFVTVTASA